VLTLYCCPLFLTGQQVSPAARQQDLDFIATQLPKLHPNFFFQLDPAQYQQAIDKLRSQLASDSNAEFYVGIAQLVAMAGDAHTSVSLSGSAAAKMGFQLLPLQFRWLDDGVFVTGAAPPYSQALGTQLVAIGGVPVADVVQQLATVIPHENDQWVHYMAQTYLTNQQILQGLHIVPVGASSAYTFRGADGGTFTLEIGSSSSPIVFVPAGNAGPLPQILRQTSSNYWFNYLPDSRLVYFKYNVCANDPSNPFPAFSASLLQALDSEPVDTFVFDFRGNTGGDSSIIDTFASGFLQRLPTLLKNPRFRVYDVIDKGTFSSGMDDAMGLKQPVPAQLAALFPGVDLTRLIRVIGEPTGGKPAHYGNVAPFTLPGSGLSGQHSMQFEPQPTYVPDLPSFMPDIPVKVRSTDYFARFDPVLAAIIARTESGPVQPSGAAIVVNGASFRSDQGLAPGSIATGFGAFSERPDEILVNGMEGQLLGATSSQINFLVPATLNPGPASISVRAGGQEIANGQTSITPTGPGIFVANPADPSQPGAVENQDFSANSPANSANAGSVLQIFATGYGDLDSSGTAPVQVFFSDTSAAVLFSGPLKQYPGLWQINARIPTGVTGQVPIFLVAGGLASNGVTVSVQ
jgi:uncharacterized protein (TIGR03437 family)